MSHRPSLKRRRRKVQNIDLILTPFIDILVALILFLLISAIFQKASILNLYLPTEHQEGSNADSAPPKGTLIPTVAVTQKGFILGKGQGETVQIPLKDGHHDFARLHENLVELRQYAQASDNIIILPEARLRYQILITTMDTCREYKSPEGKTLPLFPTVSVGEYRAQVAQAGSP